MARTVVRERLPLYCSFCGKEKAEVAYLVAGPTVFICNECVELCREVGTEQLVENTTAQDVGATRCEAGSGEALDRKTIQTLLDLLNPLHSELDRQTYDAKVAMDFDMPSDYAHDDMSITAQMERDLTQAVLILEDRKRSATLSPGVRERT
jgi:hypothetical protein